MILELIKDIRDTKRTYLIMEVLAQNPEIDINVFKYEDFIRENLDKTNVEIAYLVLTAHKERTQK